MTISKEFALLVRGKRVALVGPASSYDGLGRGAEIDAYDLVVRMNWGPWDRNVDDLGSRTDILYKRILTQAMPEEAEVSAWIADGVRWVIASPDTESNQRYRELETLIAGRIEMIPIGNVRATLLSEMKTSPLMGMMALRHLTTYGAYVSVLNQPFDHVGYAANYGGERYRAGRGDRTGNRIAPAHNIAAHIAWLTKEADKNPLVEYDDILSRRLMIPNVDAIVCIPARLGSTRFPDKPLARIAGKEMILHVIERAKESGSPVYVCTPDQTLAAFVTAHGHEAIVTPDVLTGTDCVAAAVQERFRRYKGVIVSIQGDEPLVTREDIWRLITAKGANKNYVVNGYSPIGSEADNPSVVKAVISNDGRMVYASRSPVPGSKDGPRAEWRQLGMYAFSVRDLELFRRHGKKGELEAIEDVEMLRYLEIGTPIMGALLEGTEQAVDHPEDVARVESLMGAA